MNGRPRRGVVAGVEDLDDVLRVDRPRGPGLALEAADEHRGRADSSPVLITLTATRRLPGTCSAS